MRRDEVARGIGLVSLALVIGFALACGGGGGGGGGGGDGTSSATVAATTPIGTQGDAVTIAYTLTDTNLATCSVAVQYSSDGGSTYSAATAGAGGSGTTGLASSEAGTAYTYVWDSATDLDKANENDIRIQITPNDGSDDGTAGATGDFRLDNTSVGALDTSFLSLETPGTLDSTNNLTQKSGVYTLSVAEGITLNDAETVVTLTSPAETYAVDDVILGDGTTFRFAKKVTAVSDPGDGSTVLTVQDATLNEIAEGDLSFTACPDWTTGQVSSKSGAWKPLPEYLASGEGAGKATIDPTTGAIDLDNVVIFNMPVGSSGTADMDNSTIMGLSIPSDLREQFVIGQPEVSGCAGGSLSATITSGTITLIPTATCDYDLGLLSLDSASSTLETTLTYDLTIAITASGSAKLAVHRNILPTVSVPLTIPSPPVYLDMQLEMPAGFNLDIDIDGTATVVLQGEYSLKAVMTYDDTNGFQITPTQSRKISDKSVTWSASGSVKAELYLEPTIKIMFYGLAGPYFALHTYIRADAIYPETIPHRDDLFIGVSGKAGLEINLGFDSLPLEAPDLFDIYASWDLIEPVATPTVYVYNNTAPTAYGQSVIMPAEGGEIKLAGYDPDGDWLMYFAGEATNGDLHLFYEATAFTGYITYVPHEGYTGTDSFEFRVWDFLEESEPATVSIMVLAAKERPEANFVVTTVNLYASVYSYSTDAETDTNDLQVRWDWENDGSWDTTDWTATKSASHTYSTAGTYIIAMEVKDADDMIDSCLKIVNVTNSSSNAAPEVSSVSITGSSGDVTVSYTLADDDSDACDIAVQYTGGSVGSDWETCTTSGTTSDVSPGSRTITWESGTDEPGQSASDYQVRVVPYDGTQTGTAGISSAFSLDNSTQAGAVWVTEDVSTGSGGYTNTTIDQDTNGKIHIAFYDSGNHNLKYATNITGTWATEVADFGNSVGLHCSMELFSLDNSAHISYMDLTDGTLKYATNASGMGWTRTIVDDPVLGTTGGYTSLALDSANTIHVSYYDYTDSDLKYAQLTSSWTTETVSSTGDMGAASIIAVDSDNCAHICYLDLTNGYLKYATGTCGAFTESTADSGGNIAAGYIGLALDSNKKPHVAYYDSTNKNLKYATNESGSWSASTIDSSASVGDFASLAVDSSDKIHIGYYDSTNKDLKYATNASGSWKISTIDSTDTVGYYTSILLDSNDKVHISYYDVTNLTIKYATNVSQ